MFVTTLHHVFVCGLFLAVQCGFFEDDLEYISRVFPEAVALYCPNLPYYGGFVGLAGVRAFSCPIEEDFEAYDIQITEDSGDKVGPFYGPIDEKVKDPVILLWTHRMSNRIGYRQQCPNSACVITENRNWLNNSLTKAIYFYGTMFKLTDLPLPRPEGQLWALLHEESPKNMLAFSYASVMNLFNVTATIRQESHFPLTTQYLRSTKQLESRKFMKSVEEKDRFQREGLAPVMYVQSDCGTPSDRDKIVTWLMEHIGVDSYGQCLHNKDLPSHLVDPVKGMDHKDFVELVSQYKFAISMENGVCKDYITEKLWRPLIVGTVPITFGAPNLQEWLPSTHSVIQLEDFKSIKQLADYLHYLNKNDTAYEEYRAFKKTGVHNSKLKKTLQQRPWEPDFDAMGLNHRSTKGNFVSHFDCYLCDVIHDKMEGKPKRRKEASLRADIHHYGCPLPTEFTSRHDLTLKKPFSRFWYSAWMSSYCDVVAMNHLSKGGKEWFSNDDLHSESLKCAKRRPTVDDSET